MHTAVLKCLYGLFIIKNNIYFLSLVGAENYKPANGWSGWSQARSGTNLYETVGKLNCINFFLNI